MTLTIQEHHFPNSKFNCYDVTFFNEKIRTIVTASPNIVDRWISKTEDINKHCSGSFILGFELAKVFVRLGLENFFVGLDVEWRPNTNSHVQNPVAILQLCVGGRCLIYQLMHTQFIPASLVNFLGNSSYIFVGVGVENDVEKLDADYGIKVFRFKDLRELAFEKFGAKDLQNTGLKGLTSWVLGKELDKPKSVTMSCWDQACLTLDQVRYACVDAYLSSEIGRTLICED